MRIDFSNCTEEELWKFVASKLASKGVDVILVGGAVVSIYTEGAYRSGDLDFVINDLSRKKLDSVLRSIGFIKANGLRHYRHPQCNHLFLEFATFPVAIGDDYSIVPCEIEHNGQVIKIYSPTDCVRDRLANYVHFNARECLDQALLVGRKHLIDLIKIKDWCDKENITFVFDEFYEGL